MSRHLPFLSITPYSISLAVNNTTTIQCHTVPYIAMQVMIEQDTLLTDTVAVLTVYCTLQKLALPVRGAP